jgi:hypothetical protein
MDSRDGTAPLPRRRLCFVHASELQLDAPVRGLPMPPEPVRTGLRDASLRTWQSIVDLAIARDAMFLIVAGGLFDRDPPTLRARLALRDGVERLRAQGIQVFIALGRGDPAMAVLEPWVSGATIFAEGTVTAVPVRRDGGVVATVKGLSCVRTDPDARLATRFAPAGSPLTIGVLPLALEPTAAEGAEGPLLHNLLSAGAGYWALGGARRFQTVQEDPWVVCPGTPQGRGLHADEVGAKGCVVVEVDEGRISSVSPTSLDHVRFVSIPVDLAECAEAAAVRARVRQRIESEAADCAAGIIAEVQLEGSGPVLATDRRALASALLERLRNDWATASPFVWWARVQDHSLRQAADRPAIGDDLGRALLAQSEALAAPLVRSSFLARHFAPLWRIWEGELDLGAQRELVREAAGLARMSLDLEADR